MTLRCTFKQPILFILLSPSMPPPLRTFTCTKAVATGVLLCCTQETMLTQTDRQTDRHISFPSSHFFRLQIKLRSMSRRKPTGTHQCCRGYRTFLRSFLPRMVSNIFCLIKKFILTPPKNNLVIIELFKPYAWSWDLTLVTT